jgi:hypothetical protein
MTTSDRNTKNQEYTAMGYNAEMSNGKTMTPSILNSSAKDFENTAEFCGFEKIKGEKKKKGSTSGFPKPQRP